MELVAWVHGVEVTAIEPSRCIIILVMVLPGHHLQFHSSANLPTVQYFRLSPTSLNQNPEAKKRASGLMMQLGIRADLS